MGYFRSGLRRARSVAEAAACLPRRGLDPSLPCLAVRPSAAPPPPARALRPLPPAPVSVSGGLWSLTQWSASSKSAAYSLRAGLEACFITASSSPRRGVLDSIQSSAAIALDGPENRNPVGKGWPEHVTVALGSALRGSPGWQPPQGGGDPQLLQTPAAGPAGSGLGGGKSLKFRGGLGAVVESTNAASPYLSLWGSSFHRGVSGFGDAVPNPDTEIASRQLAIGRNMYYLDVKGNPRGTYLKISERVAGKRSTLMIPQGGLSKFADLLNWYVAEGSKAGFESRTLREKLLTRVLDVEIKTFYFDVRQSSWGHFLKISEVSGNKRIAGTPSIEIPAESGVDGWAAFRDALFEVVDAAGGYSRPGAGDKATVVGRTLASARMRAGHVNVFADVLVKQKRPVVRISVSGGAEDSSIEFPAVGISELRDSLDRFQQTLEGQSGGVAGALADEKEKGAEQLEPLR